MAINKRFASEGYVNEAIETVQTDVDNISEEISDLKETGITLEEVNDAIDAHNISTSHVSATDRTNWNRATAHTTSAHAPSNAQANQNAFSIINVVDSGISTFASAPENPGDESRYICNASSATDELTLVAGSLMQMYASGNEITLGISIEAFDELANSCVEANRIGAASATEFDNVKERLDSMTTETWTFELEDGTTVTKKVVLR